MIKNKKQFGIFLLIILSLAIVTSQTDLSRSYQTVGGPSTSVQYYQPGYTTGARFTSPSVYWGNFDREVCRERQDFIVQIAPGGCQPAVVRSDLLEERTVPVFCKLMLVQTNPLIDVSRVKSIRFPGKRPEGVAGITYYPARVHTTSRNRRNLAETPLDDNMGYFVVNVKNYKTEKEMPDWIQGNLTAVIDYDIEDALGIGRTHFYVSELRDDEWERDYQSYGFWNGKGYIKTDAIEGDRVTVSVYRDFDTKISSVTLKKGETSNVIYLPGFYCTAGLKIKAESIEAPVEAALLKVDDQQIWVSQGDRIADGKCRISNVDAYAGGGKVSLSCSVSNGRFDLKLTPGKVKVTTNDEEQEKTEDYNIGSKVWSGDTGTIHLGYVGLLEEEQEKTKLAVFVSYEHSESEVEFQDKNIFTVVEKIVSKNKEKDLDDIEDDIEKAIVSAYSKALKSRSDNTFNEDDVEVLVLQQNSKGNLAGIELILGEVEVAENEDWEEKGGSEALAYEYYEKARENYQDLADLYAHEKRLEEDYLEPYAAEGLYEASKLAEKFNMKEDKADFLAKLYRDYPDSAWTRKAEEEMERMLKYDSSESRAIVYSKAGSYFIELLDFRRPEKEDLSVTLLINGKEEVLGLNEAWEEKEETIQVTQIDDDKIKLKYQGISDKKDKTETLDLNRNQQTIFEDIRVKLVNINLNKQAKLTLDSSVQNTRAYANFSFKIGIEKRGIELSPEKTKKMIENLEENIAKWNDITEKLEKVIKGLKTACFATSAILNIKNLITGFSGSALARSEVMTGPGGWNDYCEGIVGSGEASQVNGNLYSSMDACLLGHNSEIERDISLYSTQIQNTNNKLETARAGLTSSTGILDIEGQVTDRTLMEKRFKDSIAADCQGWGSVDLPKKGTEPQSFAISDSGFCGGTGWGSFEDSKEIYTLQNTVNAGGSAVLRDMSERDLSMTASTAQEYHVWDEARANAAKQVEELGMKPTYLQRDSVVYGDIHQPTNNDGFYNKDMEGKSLVAIPLPPSYSDKTKEGTRTTDMGTIGGQPVLVEIKDEDGDGIYTRGNDYNIYKKDGTPLIGKDYENARNYLAHAEAHKFKKSDAKAYQNKMADPDRMQVKYFDKAPYKGLPSEVPFDIKEGWYVEMEYITSGFGKPYDESGRVANYYICNVGPNGMIEFKRKGDDICRYYNGVSSDIGFPGMSTSESRQLVSRAQHAISEAAGYYGKTDAIINGQKFSTGRSFGGESGRCSDFMSPQDCHIMFNLCDPVICPSSRCDLGGEFQVDNVVQSGIIGSIFLCLPNIKEGIYIPVCLSGIHAGIESFVSILEAERDCLNESLETGRSIGICDEITSIYMCDFFWRQIVPFADVILPKLVEGFFNQGTRGGGEYLTVQAAWDNTENSIDYFKDQYAVNSMQAYNMRSTEQIGTEICKSFISTTIPTDFDLLTEPDSPVQFHGYFDENTMTTATPYPTSHYKVYFHIFSGNDQGAYYVIYLKDTSDEFLSSYSYTPERYIVQRGYAARGEYVDEARDFTAPSGYKQMCININGQDKCGFGKVSTSFAINYLSDKYAEEQATEYITTSKECIAGSPSLYSFAQPNLQAGAEEFVNPELYNQGIVRVCSTYNPGKQVDAKGDYDTTNSSSDRWKEVGVCDDSSIKCWLDTNSVKDIIRHKGLEEGVLDAVDTSAIAMGDSLTVERSREIASRAERFINKERVDNEQFIIQEKTTNSAAVESNIRKIELELRELAELGATNSHKARGLFLLGKLYRTVATSILGEKVEVDVRGDAISNNKQEQAQVQTSTGNYQTPEKSTYTPEYTIDSSGRIWDSNNNIQTDLIIKNNKILLDTDQEVGQFPIGAVESNKLVFDWMNYYTNYYVQDLAEQLNHATISGSIITLDGQEYGGSNEIKEECKVKFYKDNEDITGETVGFDDSDYFVELESCENYSVNLFITYVYSDERASIKEAINNGNNLENGKYEIDLSKSDKGKQLYGFGRIDAIISKNNEKVGEVSFSLDQTEEEDYVYVVIERI